MADLLRILIADNDEMIRETLKRIIRYKVRMACEIFEADTGYNAQETAYKCYPHMFITDVRMPDITAAELIKKFENKSVRFILMSGYRDFPLAREAIKLGVSDCLLKPLQEEDVVNLVTEIFEDSNLNNNDKFISIDYAKIFSKSGNNKSIQQKTVELALEFIHENYSKDINLTYVANVVSKNYKYFSVLFKNETGYNFSDYLRQLRIEKAKELLQDSSNKVYDIAKLVGMPDYAHFSKTFSKIVGMSPSEYRAKVI